MLKNFTEFTKKTSTASQNKVVAEKVSKPKESEVVNENVTRQVTNLE